MADDTNTSEESKRLKILETDEIEAVYGLPVFDDEDRASIFPCHHRRKQPCPNCMA